MSGRFAPSPTGNMHLGNARTALLAWLLSRSLGIPHILRIEDLDTTRVKKAAYSTIQHDLEWLGLDWDALYLQSERLDIYQHYLERLDTYPCTCSRKDILEAASAPHGKEAIYPKTCLTQGITAGKPTAIRWKTPSLKIEVQDQLQGTQHQNLATEVGDFVLKRNDGVFAYHFAVVVDDALMGVSHVLRGVDLWDSTPRQVALQHILGFTTPEYYHVPLMQDFRGERLAKRSGAPSLASLRAAGENPHKIIAELAKSLGWQVEPELSPQELLGMFKQNLYKLSNF